MDDAIVITIRIKPQGPWSDRAVRAIATTLEDQVADYCDLNNRPAEVKATWAIYEASE